MTKGFWFSPEGALVDSVLLKGHALFVSVICCGLREPVTRATQQFEAALWSHLIQNESRRNAMPWQHPGYRRKHIQALKWHEKRAPATL